MKIQTFDFHVDLMRSVLWQYENASGAVMLARQAQAWSDANHSQFWDSWHRDVFNVDTANDFGLSVWARILGLSLEIGVKKRTVGVFGFGTSNQNFGNGNFGRAEDGAESFDTESARKLIKLRWFQLTMRPTVPNINKALSDVFGSGMAFIQDPGDMTSVTFFFTETPDYKLRRLLENTDILPRPSTVGVRWVVRVKPSWGFGTKHLNFERGNFGA